MTKPVIPAPTSYYRSSQPQITSPQAQRQWIERELSKLEQSIASLVAAVNAIIAYLEASAT